MAKVNYVKFMRGTLEAYNKLTNKDQDTLYFLYDSTNPEENEGSLYLGTKYISGPCGDPDGGSGSATSLSDLKDVLIKELNYDSLLVYNVAGKKWENYTFEDLIFQAPDEGATIGLPGLVPAPTAAQKNYFLRGDGTWSVIANNTQVIEIINNNNTEHSELFPTEDIVLNNGDILIIKDLISNDLYQYTSYVYSESIWYAMDGNYNAENVYFKNDFIFTEPIGTVEIPEDGNATVAAAGKNIKQFMETLFAKERNPEIVYPSVELIAENNKAYEVGTSVIPTYKAALNPGKYEFDESTEVASESYSISATGVSLHKAESEGSFPEITIADDMNYYITATIKHTAGKIPVTNLNNPYEEGQIQAGSVSVSSQSLNGYRAFFWGMDASGVAIDGSFIRANLQNGGAYDGQKKIIFNALDLPGVKRFIIAIPANSSRSGLISAIITSSMNANATSDYKLLSKTINVNGANDYASIPYKVWVYEPASIASTEIHEVTLS